MSLVERDLPSQRIAHPPFIPGTPSITIGSPSAETQAFIRETLDAVTTPALSSQPALPELNLSSIAVVEARDRVTRGRIDAMPGLCPRFRSAARRIVWDGTLENACDVLVSRGMAADRQDALMAMNEWVENLPEPLAFATRADRTGRGSFPAKARLRKATGQARDNEESRIVSAAGVVAHSVSGLFARGEVWDPRNPLSWRAQNGKRGPQASYFDRPRELGSWNRLDPTLLNPGNKYRGDMGLFGMITDNYVDGVRSDWQELLDIRRQHREHGAMFLSEGLPVAWRLLHRMAAVSPPSIYTLGQFRSPEGRYILIETVCALAAKLVVSHDESKTVGHELVVDEIAATHVPQYGAPRLDGLLVSSVEGQVPGPEVYRWLMNAPDRVFASSGNLAYALEERFGEVTTSLIEYKTSIPPPPWEGFMGSGSIYSQRFELTPSQHATAAEYLALHLVDRHLLKDRWQGLPWRNVVGGRVEFLTAEGPRSVPVRLTRDEQEQTYDDLRRQARDGYIQWRARTRQTINSLLGWVASLAEGRASYRQRMRRYTESQLTALDRLHGTLKTIYLDPEHELGVYVGKNRSGEAMYRVDYGRLVKLIEDGDVRSENYRPGTNAPFWVECLNKRDHPHDEHPSMYVTPGSRTLFCFSCHGKAFIAQETLPESIEVQVVSRRTEGRDALRSIRKTTEVVISEEHLRFMSDAQQAFQKYFRGSRGAAYLAGRGFSLERVYAKGAGYGDARMIHELIVKELTDKGWAISHLVKYGIVGIRENEVLVSDGTGELPAARSRDVVEMRENECLADFLVRAGLVHTNQEALYRISRGAVEFAGVQTTDPRMLVDTSGVVTVKSRYFKWNGRSTFPLVWQGKIVSFYGRASWKFHDDIAKRKGAHRKIKVERERIPDGRGGFQWTNPPQGAWNAEILQKPGLKYVVVTEGVADALSLMEMGEENVIAIIGTYNDVSIEEIAAAGIPVYLAFDADIPGTLSTYRAYKKLRDSGHTLDIYNLTRSVFFNVFLESGLEDGGESPVVTVDDLRRYRSEGKAFLDERKERVGQREKDYNDLLLAKRSVAERVIKQIRSAPLEPITQTEYDAVYADSSPISVEGVIYAGSGTSGQVAILN